MIDTFLVWIFSDRWDSKITINYDVLNACGNDVNMATNEFLWEL